MKIDLSKEIKLLALKNFNEANAFKLGVLIENYIKDRTLKGLDKNEKQFKAYSTKPFSVPAATVPKYALAILKKSKQLQYFVKNKTKYVVIKLGYLYYKKLLFSKTAYDGTVNLTLTGNMLRSFQLQNYSVKEITLGFTRPEAVKIYYFNILKGRDFLGITEKALYELFQKSITL